MSLASIADAVITADTSGNIDYLNPAAEALVGCSLQAAIGQPLPSIFQAIDALTGAPIANPVDLAVQCPPQGQLQGDAILVVGDGPRQAIIYSAAPIRCAAGSIIRVVLVVKPVHIDQPQPNTSALPASRDALTGLFNRDEFERRLARLIDAADCQGHQHALLYLDLDRFDNINQVGGLAAGDEFLRQLACRLGTRVRGSDTLARLEDDTFCVLLVDCPLDHAVKVAQALRTSVAEFCFDWQGNRFAISASVGVAPIAGKRADNADLVSVAHAACQAAKEKGRSQVTHRSAAGAHLPALHAEDSAWLARIHDALARDCFRLCYQSIRPLAAQPATGAAHYEVLIRMLDANGDAIAPAKFMPAAERHHLTLALDRKVISMVFAECRQRAQQRTDGPAPLIFINLSLATLIDAHFPDFLLQQLACHQVEPASICLEVSESALLAALEQATPQLQKLKTIGCRISLDDFGRGPPSFDYLKNLQVDYLKIHGEFVRDMAAEPTHAALVEAINNIGHILGIETIAKWVADAESVDALLLLGVDYAQGYFFDYPQPMAPVTGKPKQVMAGF